MDDLQVRRHRRASAATADAEAGREDDLARREDEQARRKDEQARRKHHAREERRRAQRRRESQDGAARLVADRAGSWTLDGPDWTFFELQKYFWNPLMDFWFRMEVEGWDNIP